MTVATAKPPVVTPAAVPVVPKKVVKAAPIAAKRKVAATVKAPVAKKAIAPKPVVAAPKPALAKTAKPTKPVKPLKPAKPAAVAKPAKVKKAKMVRDSMTMPKAEYAVLDTLKLRAIKLASPVKKTELLRAGIKALAAMTDASFLAALKAVPSLKTGRPSKS
jgi:hypothetical protein